MFNALVSCLTASDKTILGLHGLHYLNLLQEKCNIIGYRYRTEDFNKKEIMEEMPCWTRNRTRTCVTQTIEAGYLMPTAQQDAKGKFSSETLITDKTRELRKQIFNERMKQSWEDVKDFKLLEAEQEKSKEAIEEYLVNQTPRHETLPEVLKKQVQPKTEDKKMQEAKTKQQYAQRKYNQTLVSKVIQQVERLVENKVKAKKTEEQKQNKQNKIEETTQQPSGSVTEAQRRYYDLPASFKSTIILDTPVRSAAPITASAALASLTLTKIKMPSVFSPPSASSVTFDSMPNEINYSPTTKEKMLFVGTCPTVADKLIEMHGEARIEHEWADMRDQHRCGQKIKNIGAVLYRRLARPPP